MPKRKSKPDSSHHVLSAVRPLEHFVSGQRVGLVNEAQLILRFQCVELPDVKLSCPDQFVVDVGFSRHLSSPDARA
jgi:hypothetical protein